MISEPTVLVAAVGQPRIKVGGLTYQVLSVAEEWLENGAGVSSQVATIVVGGEIDYAARFTHILGTATEWRMM